MAGLLLAAFLALFYRWMHLQHQHSWGSEDWSHAYVVPLISGYAAWSRRREIAAVRPSAFWPGLLPLVLGVLCYFFFIIVFPNHMLQGVALILSLAGVCLLLLGPRVFPLIAFPIAYLGFAVTIAEMVMIKVTGVLQRWASVGAEILMSLLGGAMGFMTTRAGNVLNVTTKDGTSIPLNVAEACSGMRMVVAFVALGAAVAFISCRRWWQRIALLLLAAPVAVLVNVFRVAFLGVASIFDAELSKGEAHMMIGVLWLLPAFFLYMGIVWALKRMAPEDEKAGAAA